MSRTTRGWAWLLIVSLLVVAGCSRSPEAQKARHLERGDKFAAREQYQEAILEYRNVLRLDPANARAIRQLGLSYDSLGEGPSAFRYLLKAQQLTPDDHEVRLRLGRIYLLVGKREEARKEASVVLSTEPNNLDALALLADTSITPQEVDATIGLLEGQRATLGDRAKFHSTLGVLYLRRQDLLGAERAFQEAVARELFIAFAHWLPG
jgi:Flp pilus assembly protein TadD